MWSLICIAISLIIAGPLREEYQIVFKVNMKNQMLLHNFKEARGDYVIIRGNFNDWKGNEYVLNDKDKDGVYEIKLRLNNVNVEYKYVIITGDKRIIQNKGWEIIKNRVRRTNESDGKNVDYFNNINILNKVNINLKVDMSNQVLLKKFSPENDDIVVIRGTFNSWVGEEYILNQKSNYIYETNSKAYNLGNDIEFKYVIVSTMGQKKDIWEDCQNRTIQNHNDSISYFNNERGVVLFQVDMSDKIAASLFLPNMGDSIAVKLMDSRGTEEISNILKTEDKSNVYKITIQFKDYKRYVKYKYIIIPADRSKIIEEKSYRTLYLHESATILGLIKYNEY